MNEKRIMTAIVVALLISIFLTLACAENGDDDDDDDGGSENSDGDDACGEMVDRIYADCGFAFSGPNGTATQEEAAQSCRDEWDDMWQCIDGCHQSADICDDLGACIETCLDMNIADACETIASNLYQNCDSHYVDPNGNQLSQSETEAYCANNWNDFWLCLYEALYYSDTCSDWQALSAECY